MGVIYKKKICIFAANFSVKSGKAGLNKVKY